MANGKEPAAAGQMENHLNFAICPLPFELLLRGRARSGCQQLTITGHRPFLLPTTDPPRQALHRPAKGLRGSAMDWNRSRRTVG
jgi:hypothetical protein